MKKPEGLTGLSLAELKKLLGHVHREEAEFPLNAQRVARIGFQHRQELLINALRGVDARGARAALVCVIAERMKAG